MLRRFCIQDTAALCGVSTSRSWPALLPVAVVVGAARLSFASVPQQPNYWAGMGNSVQFATRNGGTSTQRLVDMHSSAAMRYATGGAIDKWRDQVKADFFRAIAKGKKKMENEKNGANSDTAAAAVDEPSSLPHPGSTAEAEFACARCSATWSARIRERNDAQQDRGCPVCARTNTAERVLAHAYPEIALEWDAQSNSRFTRLDPSTAQVDSEATVWWHCALCYGQWVATIKDRVAGRAHCPTCVTTRVDPTLQRQPNGDDEGQQRHLVGRERQSRPRRRQQQVDGVSDTATAANAAPIRSPQNEYDRVAQTSADRGLWSCSRCGETWTGATHRQRMREGTLCPSCSGQALTRSNALVIARPDVVRDIAPSERRQLHRYDGQSVHSLVKLLFRCRDCQREYYMSIRQKCSHPADSADRGCPHCASARRALAMETAEERSGRVLSITAASGGAAGGGGEARHPRRAMLPLGGHQRAGAPDVSMRPRPGSRSPLTSRPFAVKPLPH